LSAILIAVSTGGAAPGFRARRGGAGLLSGALTVVQLLLPAIAFGVVLQTVERGDNVLFAAPGLEEAQDRIPQYRFRRTGRGMQARWSAAPGARGFGPGPAGAVLLIFTGERCCHADSPA
jgi:hypothetical protein